jgi:glycosyltransferase involved in cell wall biosynthesis
VPWIADFRDPWIDNPVAPFPTPVHRRLNVRLERSVLEGASAIIANTPANRADLCRRYPALGRKTRVVTNGYDDEDPTITPATATAADAMTIVHAGTIWPQYDGRPFLEGVAAAVVHDGIRHSLRVRLIGSTSESSTIARLGLEDTVFEEPRRSRETLMHELHRADVLLLCMSGVGRSARFWVPAKTYTYMATGRPILALVGPGQARDLLSEAGFSLLCAPDDPQEICDCLVQIHGLWRSGSLIAHPNWGVIDRYRGTALAAQLAEVLEQVAGSLTPGGV